MRAYGNSLESGSAYRHLEQKWVHEFFHTGTLRLTTLAYCREHEISSRADPRDGRINFSIRDNWQMMAGLSTAGQQSYMLCASKSRGPDIQNRFNTDGWIEIVDVAGFADAVAEAIGCSGAALVGSCRYVDAKEANKGTQSPISETISPLFTAVNDSAADIETEFRKANARIAQFAEGQIGDDAYFMKDRQPYEIEEEVRFVWPAKDVVDGPKVFSCPGAREFCKAGP
jgi:hypothetical protein